MATASDTTPQSEVNIVSVIIEISDINDNNPVWTSVFSAISIPEVSLGLRDSGNKEITFCLAFFLVPTCWH